MVPDDIMVMDDDLDIVDVFGGSRSNDTNDDDRNLRLMQKSKDASRKRAVQSDTYVVDTSKDNLVECLCPNCGHVFYIGRDEQDVDCPYCQTKHHFEEAEELHLTRQAEVQEMTKLEKLVAKDKQQKRRQQFIVFKPLDTYENDAKTQTSLQMGTAEYNEYVEDLKEQAPSAPDDAFHVDLEDRNAALRETMVAVAAGKETGDLVERKAAGEAMKREIHDEARAVALVHAGYTETKSDDLKLSKLGIDNPLIHDMGVSVDDYEAALEDFSK